MISYLCVCVYIEAYCLMHKICWEIEGIVRDLDFENFEKGVPILCFHFISIFFQLFYHFFIFFSYLSFFLCSNSSQNR